MGLRTRIIVFFVVAFGIANLGLCFYITHQVKTLELEKLQTQIDKSAYLMRRVNTLPLYNVDMESLKLNMETFFDDENIKSLSIHDSEVNININLIRQLPPGGIDIKKSFVIDYKGLTLGRLTVVYSTGLIEQKLAKYQAKMLLITALVMVVIAVGFSMLIHILTNPVANLARVTTDIAAGDFDSEVVQTGVGEVKTLSRNFALMCNTIKKQKEEIASAYKRIEDEISHKNRQKREMVHHQQLTSCVNTFIKKSLTAQSMQDVAQIFIPVAQDLIPGPYCFVGQICDAENNLKIIALSDKAEKECPRADEFGIYQGFRQHVSGRLHQAITTKIPVISNNVSLCSEFSLIPGKHLPIDTIMAVPVLQDQEVFGLVVFAGKDAGYTPEDQTLATMMVLFLGATLNLRRREEENQRLANMLAFSGITKEGFVLEDVSRLLDQALELASGEYGTNQDFHFSGIQIIRDFYPDLPKVKCRAGELKQVFFNILSNGAYALAGHTDNPCPTFFLRTYGKDDQVCIEIRDNGPGMSENIRRRIFEPLFSTKPDKEDAGLGLSVAYFIITKNHNGTIEVESTPGEGTCFRIFLPF
nr:ATP-binding protein [uncultured Desulfobacter sp.]